MPRPHFLRVCDRKDKGVKVTEVESDSDFKEMNLFDFWDLDGNIINVIAI